MFDDLFQAETDAAIAFKASLPPPPPKPVAKWNGWSSVPRGITGAVAEVAGSVSEFGQATSDKFGEVMGQKDASIGDIFKVPFQLGSDAATGPKEGQFTSEVGTSFRNVAHNYRPDPATASTAERLTFDLSRFVTKAVGYTVMGGGLPGALALGGDEGMTVADDLGRQGVDIKTRTKAGTVAGVAATAGVVLPVAAPGSLLKTAGLWAAGGPGAFVAQQAATRSILRDANYKELAESYDPLDPVGLAVSSLVPAGFAGYALHSAAKATRAQAAIKSIADGQPIVNTAAPENTPAQGLTPDQADAVMTHNLTLAQDVRDATTPHEAAVQLRVAEMVGRKQRELDESLAALQGASKQPELARREGVNIKDPEGLQQRIAELQAERSAWDDWSTNPERVAQIRDELGLTPHQPSSGIAMEPRLAAIYEKAGAVKPIFDGRLMEVADALGAHLKLAKLKGVDRAVDKIAADYGGDATRIKDLVRGTVVVKSLQDVEHAVAGLRAKFDVLDTGYRNGLTEPATNPNGYRDVKMNVRIDGHVAEVQVNLKEMMAAKHEAHPLYEESDTLLRKIEGENRAPTQDEVKRLNELEARQKELYTAAWADITNERNLDSSSTPPLLTNDVAGNLRGSPLSQAVQTQSGDLLTGTPSTSANTVPGGKDSGSSGGSFMSMPDILPENGLFSNEPSQVHKDPLTRSVLGRAAELERFAPDMVVGKDAQGNDLTIKQEMERIRRESIEGTDSHLGTQDAALLEVAANCALSLGAGA